MKVAVFGLWHLGCVTAACLASSSHEVIACDPNPDIVGQLNAGQPPIFEPGLTELIQQGTTSGHLTFSSTPSDIQQAEVVWITLDTPVDDDDNADVEYVFNQVKALFPYIAKNAAVLISSQVPAGTTHRLQAAYDAEIADSRVTFSYSPENLRLGKAIEVFTQPDRIIVGVDDDATQAKLLPLISSISDSIIWMSVASAEMTKHAINAFLATSVTFINELSTICEKTGADAREVERGLKSEVRIGPKAYLRPGEPFAGGTLARDINYLQKLGQEHNLPTHLFNAITDSNNAHKQWIQHKLNSLYSDLNGKQITLLGLTYKSDTDTLRRSSAIELADWLKQQGAIVNAYDPTINELPAELKETINLHHNLQSSINNADATIVSCFKPSFSSLDKTEFLAAVNDAVIIDSGASLEKLFHDDQRFQYHSVGRQLCS